MRISGLGRLLILGACCIVGGWGPDLPFLVSRLGGSSFPAALVALGSLVALLLSVWVLLVSALVLAGASSRLVGAVSPRMLRHAILVGAAGALVIGPAHAEQAGSPDTGLRHSVSGLPLPDRPEGGAARAPAPRADAPVAPPAAAEPVDPGAVEVVPGDTLWSIASRALPADATAAQIAAATTAWHRANRDVIGADPDLIVPAQRLVPPTTKDLP
jgi:hypothetical protein